MSAAYKINDIPQSIMVCGTSRDGNAMHQRSHSSLNQRYPMHVMLVRDACQITSPIMPHEEHLKTGRLQVVLDVSEMVLVFVSHQWAGTHHPDPHGYQFIVLQQAMHRLSDGVLTPVVSMIDSVFEGKIAVPSTCTRRDVMNWGIWYDYFSCPQDPANRTGLLDAVVSIPSYVDRCNYFFVLAPMLRHSDHGHILSYTSWQKRGWCRLELAACALSLNQKTPLLLLSPYSFRAVGLSQWPTHWPHNGQFSMEEDRQIVLGITLDLLDQKSRYLQHHSFIGGFRFLQAVRQAVSLSSCELAASSELLVRKSETAEPEYLKKYALENMNDMGDDNLTPIMLAAIENNIMLAMSLFDKGHSTQRRMSPRVTQKTGLAGLACDVVGIASMFGSQEVMGFLLSKRVDPKRSCCQAGYSPLLVAAVYGRLGVAKLLVEHRADVHQVGQNFQTPLLAAAMFGHQHTASWFIDKRADLECVGNPLATNPMKQAACCTGNVEVLRLLVDERADVNGTGKLSNLGYLLRAVCKCLPRQGHYSELIVAMSNIPAPPLCCAVLTGDLYMIEELIALRAEPDAACPRGTMKPLALAQKLGLEDIVAFLADVSHNPARGTSLSKYVSAAESHGNRNASEAEQLPPTYDGEVVNTFDAEDYDVDLML